jgi:hypothetical protein
MFRQKTLTIFQLIQWVVFVLLLTILESLPVYWFMELGSDEGHEEEARILMNQIHWTNRNAMPMFIFISMVFLF